MKRSIICTLVILLFSLVSYSQVGVFKKVISDSVFSLDYRFRSLPNYSLLNATTNIISPTTGTYDLTTPPGTTAQRPTVPTGKYILRYNTDSAALEIGNPSQVWKTLSMSSVQTFDTTAISNFGLKVRSLFSASAPLQYNAVTGNLTIPQATSSTSGYLSQADWVVFNSRLPDPGSNGLVARTAAGITQSRQLVAGSTNVTLNNANGVSGNPVIDINDTLILTQLQLPYIPAALSTADSALFLNRTTGLLEVRPVPNGTSGSINNGNIGSGLRWLDSTTQKVKTVFPSNTIGWDSTSNTNGLTAKVDTSVIATQYDLTLLTAANGITRNVNTFELGGTLNQNTTINTTSAYSLNINGNNTGITTGNLYLYNNGTTGTALFAETNGGYAGRFHAITGGSASTAIPVLSIGRGGGSISNGIGTILEFKNQTTINGFNSANTISNQLISKWTDATDATRTSQFEIWGVNSTTLARKMSISGAGQITMDGYTGSNFQTTDSSFNSLVIDGSGNVYKRAGDNGSGGGGGATLNNTGSGYRWAATPSGDVKTFFTDITGIIDSASNANGLTYKVDTGYIATQNDLIPLNDRISILENTQWYLDGNAGNDLNDGKSPERSVRTVTKLLTLPIQKHDVVNVARSSYFREFLNLSTLDSITVRDYGLGKKPVFDAADVAPNSQFSLRGGTTNVYKITWTNAFRDNTDISNYGVWEDGKRLIRQTSIANVDANPGTYFYSGVTQSSGTDTIYVHASNSSNISTNGRLYEITRRPMGIHVRDGCKVYNMHTRRNGSNNGSIETRHNSYIQGVIAEDGTKHNFFMASGTAENCVAWKCDSAFTGGTTMFVSFTTSVGADTMDVLYKNCIAIAGKNSDPYISTTIIGVYAHVGAPAPTYRRVTVDGGSYIQCAYGIDGEPTYLTVRNANFLKCAIGISKNSTGELTVLSNTFAATPAPVSSNAPKIFFHHNKISGIGVDKVIVGNLSDSISATYNTVNGGTINAFIQDEIFSNPAITFKHNTFTSNSNGNAVALLAPTNATSTNANLHLDSNSYSTCIYVFADGVKTLANMQAIGKETNSTNGFTESRFYGDFYTSDFFLPKMDATYGVSGSENTFDSIYRFPYNVFNLPQTIFQSPTTVRPKSDFSEDNNVEPTHAMNAQNLYIYKDAFSYNTLSLTDSSKRIANTEFVKQLVSTGGYTLPIATTTVLGGVKQGTGLTIDGTGVANVTATLNTITTNGNTTSNAISTGAITATGDLKTNGGVIRMATSAGTNRWDWVISDEGSGLYGMYLYNENNGTIPFYLSAGLDMALNSTNIFMPNVPRSASTTDSTFWKDPVTGKLEWRKVNTSGSTTLYSGDGTLAGNRIVTGSNNDLTFTGIDQFKIATTYLGHSKTDGSRVYSSAIGINSSQYWQFGYSGSVVGSFPLGIGMVIDTLNNIGLGDSPEPSSPLYSNGSSTTVAWGLQSENANYFKVNNITTNTTLNNLNYNFLTVDATSGNVTITLPAASASFGNSMGLDLIFKRLDSSGNTVTIQRAGSDTIDGTTSFSLTTQYESKAVRAISTSVWAIH